MFNGGKIENRGLEAVLGVTPVQRQDLVWVSRATYTQYTSEVKDLAGLPPLSDVVTVRALRLEPEIWSALAGRLAAGAILLSWSGAAPPALPAEFEPEHERLLPGSRDRWLRGYRLRGTRERSEEGSRERS